MKTEKEIINDMQELVHKAKLKKKRKPNLDRYSRLLKIVRVMSDEEVRRERSKQQQELNKTMAMFPKYLDEFTGFKKKNPEHQERLVKAIFLREFGIAKMKRRLKDLDYLLNTN